MDEFYDTYTGHWYRYDMYVDEVQYRGSVGWGLEDILVGGGGGTS